MVILPLLFVVGCGQSFKKAQIALDKSYKSDDEITQAFFIKSWGMNRALITESREKFVAQAKLVLAKNPQLSPEDILNSLNEELGKDEVSTSENFAYLSLLMIAKERANGWKDIIDQYIESNKPILSQLSAQVSPGYEDFKANLGVWKPILSDAEQMFGQAIDKIKQKMGK
jgi:hypothetical protein